MTRIPPQIRRRDLVAAAIRVIARDGVAATTTRAIAAEAGMSLASLHYVFGSRDALLEAVIEQVTADELDAASDALAVFDHLGGTGDLSALLVVAVDRFIDLMVADPDGELALAELTSYARRAGLVDLLEKQHRIYLDAARASLTAAADQAGVRWQLPPEQIARLLVTLLDGLTFGWLAYRDEAAARANGRLCARAVAGLAGPDTTHRTETAHQGASTC